MALRKLQNFIGGEYRDAVDGRTSTLINPSTGEGFAEAPVSGQADVDAAMQAAERGFEKWRDATPSERSRALLKIADAMEERATTGEDAAVASSVSQARLRARGPDLTPPRPVRPPEAGRTATVRTAMDQASDTALAVDIVSTSDSPSVSARRQPIP